MFGFIFTSLHESFDFRVFFLSACIVSLAAIIGDSLFSNDAAKEKLSGFSIILLMGITKPLDPPAQDFACFSCTAFLPMSGSLDCISSARAQR